ncbi:zinc dependent phospholipase C family protein [Pseudorhodoferax sp. Leaf267]|uniref:zinc dependent phospholipase C family protein n=1 Tax=Pseudorhodoferax sp. Leaf267 TaxID=1736316 RepID=UPI0012E1E669|nr:zinc dependent phospholipase C family protein [Pseudorhodoferax sp. Leaf267]
MSNLVVVVALLIGTCGLVPSAAAFGVGTHQHIGRSILGKLDAKGCTIAVEVKNAPPFLARLNGRACRAIGGKREAFLAGTVGPDAFPDLIVGQMTTHPGVASGWQADDWLRHLLAKATSDEEIAFAYGYVVHAGTDIFAHSYVNHYAGDIFELSKGGTIAEARHFALEKFIDVMLLRHDGFNDFALAAGEPEPHTRQLTVRLEGSPPAEWLARVLILDPEASAQYERIPAAAHLVGMRLATVAIASVGSEYRKLRARLLEQGSQIAAEMLLAQAGILGAEAALVGAREHSNDMAAKWKAAKEFFAQRGADVASAREKVEKLEKDLQEISARIEKLENDFSPTQLAIYEARGGLDALEQAVKWAQDTADRECKPERVCTQETQSLGCGLGMIALCLPQEVCREVVRAGCDIAKWTLQQELDKLNAAKSGVDEAQKALDQLNTQFSAARAREASLKALKGTADFQLVVNQTAMDAAETLAREHERFYADAAKKLTRAEEEFDAAKDRMGLAKALQTAVTPVVDRLDLINLYLLDWEAGAKRAATEYIEASWSASRAVAAGDDGSQPYKRWLDCSYRRFLGVPGGLVDLECHVSDEIEKANKKLKEAIESLPPELQWLINPIGELSQMLQEKLRPELQNAVAAAADAVAGEPTGRFLQMLSGYARVDEGLLTSTFDDLNADALRILRLPNIVAMVYEDLGTSFRLSTFGGLKPDAENLLAQQIAAAMSAKPPLNAIGAQLGHFNPVLPFPPLPGVKPPIKPGLGPWKIGSDANVGTPQGRTTLFSRYLAFDRFKAYRNADTLSTLALLEPEELNRLVRHLAPEFKSELYNEFATPLYDERVPRPFTLLLDSVRSLDGNHQWQSFGLPYPRRTQPAEPVDSELRRFGYGVHDHPEKGLRLFADPVARQAVFRRLFDGPIEGSLLGHPAMTPAVYRFVACPSNPFPTATTDDGLPADGDDGCKAWAMQGNLPQVHPETPNMAPKTFTQIKKTPTSDFQKFMDAVKAAGELDK